MDFPAVDDDICILKHEYGPTESPMSVCSGDESVASHFALVTAYEDIKKRLRDTEKENALLKRRAKQLEDKHFRTDAPPSEGPQYMNKAFSAYRGIYIEKEDLQMELNTVKKEKVELERVLTEQLQAKELELLQLKSEIDTSQVMRSLNTADDWQVDRSGSEMKIVSLEKQLERLQLENCSLDKPCGTAGHDDSENDVLHDEQQHDVSTDSRTLAIVQSYQDVLGEVSRLRSAIRSQSDLVRKLRERPPLPPTLRRAASTVPVQCLDDVEQNTEPMMMTPPRPPSAPHLPSSSGTRALDGLRENCSDDPCPLARPVPLGCPGGLPPLHQRMGSLEDSSWSFPSTPRPSDALFWDSSKSKSSNTDWARPY
ncbi:5-azacytidine-induced protein 2-like [Xyrauchen texanus]|uniref:5-azacytidine-induced protein 2-like n=1 Tax=Xyrauchen texanus TaxID=154827 RepID=UPI00224290A7|nr:5-azacytidine-induced protein 2-like [Xyrauchen texanus]XP_052003123.1 5-azacytidine-induced protein 2-like [Xyrauchen texanus]